MAIDATEAIQNGLTPAERRHLGALEKRIERGMSTFREVGEALMEIRDDRLYRETHGTFDSYCRDRWQFDRNRAYQLIGAAEVARAIGPEFPPIANEAQARELVALVRESPSLVTEVWREVTSTDEPISAARVRSVVRQHVQHDDPAPASPVSVALTAIDRAVSATEKWVASRPRRDERARVREAGTRLMEAIG